MKSVFDPSFKYTPSFRTDVRKTFERIRREQQARDTEEQQAQVLGVAPVTKLILPAQRRGGGRT